MKARSVAVLLCTLPVLFSLSCAPSEEPAPKSTKSASSSQALRLAAEPSGARAVLEAKAQATETGEIVVVGRVSATPVPGFAIFKLTDDKLDYCGRGADPMDNCETPWDYCCITGDVQAEHSLVVEARDEKGNLLADPLEDLRLLDLVVAKGKPQKDEHGNVTIVASGWFRRERPELREGLHWPKR